MLKNAPGKSHHDAQVFSAYFTLGQTLVTLGQVARKIGGAVAMNLDVGYFDLVEDCSEFPPVLSDEWSR